VASECAYSNATELRANEQGVALRPGNESTFASEVSQGIAQADGVSVEEVFEGAQFFLHKARILARPRFKEQCPGERSEEGAVLTREK
jgi:hypothetical protein